MTERTVRIILRTEVPESVADLAIEVLQRAGSRLAIWPATSMTARTIEWAADGKSGTQIKVQKINLHAPSSP